LLYGVKRTCSRRLTTSPNDPKRTSGGLFCGAKHSSPSAANTKCVEKCIGGGSDPVLVSDGKVIKLDSDSKDKAKALAGKNVTVDGTMEGDALKINSISEAK